MLGYDVIWPYELFNQDEIATRGADAFGRIMEGCRDALRASDLVVARRLMAWELGFAHAKGIPAVGIRTDVRYCGETQDARVNAMIAGSMPICLSKMERFRKRQGFCAGGA